MVMPPSRNGCYKHFLKCGGEKELDRRRGLDTKKERNDEKDS